MVEKWQRTNRAFDEAAELVADHLAEIFNVVPQHEALAVFADHGHLNLRSIWSLIDSMAALDFLHVGGIPSVHPLACPNHSTLEIFALSLAHNFDCQSMRLEFVLSDDGIFNLNATVVLAKLEDGLFQWVHD